MPARGLRGDDHPGARLRQPLGDPYGQQGADAASEDHRRQRRAVQQLGLHAVQHVREPRARGFGEPVLAAGQRGHQHLGALGQHRDQPAERVRPGAGVRQQQYPVPRPLRLAQGAQPARRGDRLPADDGHRGPSAPGRSGAGWSAPGWSARGWSGADGASCSPAAHASVPPGTLISTATIISVRSSETFLK